jgi:hypothetical protein
VRIAERSEAETDVGKNTRRKCTGKEECDAEAIEEGDEESEDEDAAVPVPVPVVEKGDDAAAVDEEDDDADDEATADDEGYKETEQEQAGRWRGESSPAALRTLSERSEDQ